MGGGGPSVRRGRSLLREQAEVFISRRLGCAEHP